ncbi:MAG: rhodanese-like domain-containing protein [Chloroflexi bacterium]|nr:rhodanese-like domain-containing protein [Chloroflexota bacterium]
MPVLGALGWENALSLKGGSFGGWAEAGFPVVDGLPPEAPALNAAAPLVIYCGSGHRSIIGMSILRAYGYETIRSLVGGLGAWTEAGFPVVEYAGS